MSRDDLIFVLFAYGIDFPLPLFPLLQNPFLIGCRVGDEKSKV